MRRESGLVRAALVGIAMIAVLGSLPHLVAASSPPSLNWKQITPSPPVPTIRDSAAMAYDTSDSEMLLFGGETVATNGSTTNCYQDTWTYKGGAWAQLTTSTAPSIRWGAAMAYDTADGYIVLFGGGCTSYLGDTWEFHNGQWTQLNIATSPQPRAYASMAYDAADGYVLLYGGTSATGTTTTYYADSWEFKAGVWTQLAPSSNPPGRNSASMTYDSTAGKVLLFGGSYIVGKAITLYSDTWAFVGGGWTQLSESSVPTARTNAQMSYLPAASGVILWGGLGLTGGKTFTVLQDTWLNSGGTWTQLAVNNTPTSRAFGSMDYYPPDSSLLLSSGIGIQGGSQFINLGDNWELSAPAPAPQAGLSTTMLIIIIAVVAAAAVAALLVVIMMRRRRPRVAPQAPYAQAQWAAPPTASQPTPVQAPSSVSYAAPQPAPVVQASPPAAAAQPQQAATPSPAKSLFCPRCGAPTPADAGFCQKCGRALPVAVKR